MLLSKIIFVRYHMFLTSLSQCCKDLEDNLASREYEMALEAVLSAAEHTNTMMWVGSMVNCPYSFVLCWPTFEDKGTLFIPLKVVSLLGLN